MSHPMNNNTSHNGDDNSQTDEYKYYEHENESVNVTCEEYETFSQSRGRENERFFNAFQNDTSNNPLQHNTLRRNINNLTNNINNNNVNTGNASNNHFHQNDQSDHEDNLDDSNPSINNNLNIQLNVNNSFAGPNQGGRNFENQIDEIYESLTYLITTEKNTLKNEKLNLKRERSKFNEKKTIEISKLQQEKEIWAENLKIVETINCKESDILDLDVGGTQKFSTSRSTLMKYPNSALSAMFSGRHELPKHNGRIFIDRDGNVFLNMVNYLRTGKFPIFKEKTSELAFYEELDFWQIPIKDYDNNVSKNQLQFDGEWCANTLLLEQNNTIVKKHNCQHGIIFCKAPLDMYNPYIEFKVVMNIPSRGKSHLFVGLVDKSKYKYEHLVSTFWKDSPSSYYWDVWNTKLIKTDENGTQVGSVGGYGCQCEEYETKIAIKYDHKSRSVSFFKNGLCQGVAFKNVPSSLHPSLDIWFESGSIEILKTNNSTEKVYL